MAGGKALDHSIGVTRRMDFNLQLTSRRLAGTLRSMMTPDLPSRLTRVPLRIGQASAFEWVRRLLQRSGYEHDALCELLGIERLTNLGRTDRARLLQRPRTPLTQLARLFILRESVVWLELAELFEHGELAALIGLDLIRQTNHPDRFAATVLLYPAVGLWLASDHPTEVDGAELALQEDLVFPGIYSGTLQLIRLLPTTRAQRALEIGTGSGIVAFALAKVTEQVVATDIAERSVHFARFNGHLNGIDNVELRTGDLYGPAGDETYDWIVSHPPFVPSIGQSVIFRDGGILGEDIIRREIAGLPDHLRPGGSFLGLSAAFDTEEGQIEDRIRGWLGPSEHEFDIVLGIEREQDVTTVVERLQAFASPDDAWTRNLAGDWQTILAREGALRRVYGAIVVRRRTNEQRNRTPVTLRRRLAEGTDWSAFAYSLDFHRWLSDTPDAELNDQLLKMRPVLGRQLNVVTRHVVEGGILLPADFVLESSWPFESKTRVEPWMTSILTECTGVSTVAEIWERLRDGLPDEFDMTATARLIARFLERGYVTEK